VPLWGCSSAPLGFPLPCPGRKATRGPSTGSRCAQPQRRDPSGSSARSWHQRARGESQELPPITGKPPGRVPRQRGRRRQQGRGAAIGRKTVTLEPVQAGTIHGTARTGVGNPVLQAAKAPHTVQPDLFFSLQLYSGYLKSVAIFEPFFLGRCRRAVPRSCWGPAACSSQVNCPQGGRGADAIPWAVGRVLACCKPTENPRLR